MSKEFRNLMFLYIICAIFIFGGFYLTGLPTIIQIIILLIGLILTIYTFIKLTTTLIRQFKND